MDTKELARICEAILFAAGEPVETERLSFAAETDPDEVRSVMKELMDRYAFERRGIRILRLEDSWQMCSQNDLAPWVTRALETRKPPRLSASQLETLTIIAYYQPTTKAFVEKLRGVDSAWSVSALLNKKLIEEAGRLEAPGRPILYRTTPDFLRTFGLESLADLPEMEKVQFSASADAEATGSGQQATGDTAVGAVIGRPPEAKASDPAVGAGVPDGPQSLPLEDRAVRGTASFSSQLRSFAAEMDSSAQVAAPQALTDEVGSRQAGASDQPAANRSTPSSASLRSAPSPQGEGIERPPGGDAV